MIARLGIEELFSTFLQFEADYFSGWATDSKLRRSIQICLVRCSEVEATEQFWALYWHCLWQTQSKTLAEAHLSAYLQETCYWATHRTIRRLASVQYQLPDCFQMAIAEVPKVLKTCQLTPGKSLKAYASVAFGNIIRDTLRQRREVDLCSDWGLLLKLSRKQLLESLRHAGLSPEMCDRYLLAWTCLEETYKTPTPGVRKLTRPDPTTWGKIAQLYNQKRQTQLSLIPSEGSPEVLEKWLIDCADRARSYLYPNVTSLNISKGVQGLRELQDDLPSPNESLLDTLIHQESSEVRQTQQAQIHTVLTQAMLQLDDQAQLLLKLYYQQELTQQQIAKMLNLQQYAVSRKLSKVREALLLTLARWSQEHLHISSTSNVVKQVSPVLEEWLQAYYQGAEPHS